MSEFSASLTDEKPSPFFFLRKFLRHGKRVASVAPSSQSLAAAMCAHVNPAEPQTIVELGAGTGAVTEYVAKAMHPEGHLIAVEIDRQFSEILHNRCPEATVVCRDVRELPDALGDAGIGHVDLLLNGLPTPSLPKPVNAVVLDTFAALGYEGWFSQLTVMPWVYWPTYRRLFDEVQFQLVVKNVPPGGVYHCRGLNPSFRSALPGAKSKSA